MKESHAQNSVISVIQKLIKNQNRETSGVYLKKFQGTFKGTKSAFLLIKDRVIRNRKIAFK